MQRLIVKNLGVAQHHGWAHMTRGVKKRVRKKAGKKRKFRRAALALTVFIALSATLTIVFIAILIMGREGPKPIGPSEWCVKKDAELLERATNPDGTTKQLQPNAWNQWMDDFDAYMARCHKGQAIGSSIARD